MRESKARPTGGIATVRGKLIPLSKAEEMYPLGRNWFYRHMRAGTLPFPWYQLSVGKRLVDTADIEDWIELKRVPAGSMPGDIGGAHE